MLVKGATGLKVPWKASYIMVIPIEMLYRRNQGHNDYEFEFPSMVQTKKNYQWPLTKDENNLATLDQCAVSDEVFRGKK